MLKNFKITSTKFTTVFLSGKMPGRLRLTATKFFLFVVSKKLFKSNFVRMSKASRGNKRPRQNVSKTNYRLALFACETSAVSLKR